MFKNFTITKKLTLLVTLVVVVTAGVLGYSVNNEYDKLLTKQELISMGESTGEEATKILTTIERMKEDVIFLGATPPIQGLVRTQKNNGIDPLDGSSERLWKKRLSTIFESFLVSKPHYLKIRYIGIKNNGKELVRVDKLDGKIKYYLTENLQNKENRDYYKKGTSLKDKEVYLTDVNYNREFGKITIPYTPVMRAVTPIYTEKGKIFGIVVLNLDVNFLFSKFLSKNKNNLFRYITNSHGNFLSQHKDNKIFAFEFGGSSAAITGHQEWGEFITLPNKNALAKKIKHHDRKMALYARKLFFDENNKNRFLTLTEEKPYEQVVAESAYVKNHSMFISMFLLFPALILTVVFSYRITKPLKQITTAVTNFKESRSAFKLDIKSKDEIGALATAFYEMVEDLDQAQEQLIQSEKMASIGQLAAGVAHEINNPVGFIGSNIYTLKTYCDDLLEIIKQYESTDEYLKANDAFWIPIEKIKKEKDFDYLKGDLRNLISESSDGVKRVKDIVQDLKDFSHVDEAEWQWANIHSGLDSTLNIVNNEIKYKADVIKKYGEIPEVECLASQLNQVFMNLLVNAAHAIDEHGTITIETGLTDSDWVWISISDTGKGIPKSKLKKIFDPFFTTKPIGQGTGLGLSLSYGIIEKHSGRIDVESDEGVGTKFVIWLPVKQPDSTEAA